MYHDIISSQNACPLPFLLNTKSYAKFQFLSSVLGSLESTCKLPNPKSSCSVNKGLVPSIAALVERVNINLLSQKFPRLLRRHGSLKTIFQQIFTKHSSCAEPTIVGAGGVEVNQTPKNPCLRGTSAFLGQGADKIDEMCSLLGSKKC